MELKYLAFIQTLDGLYYQRHVNYKKLQELREQGKLIGYLHPGGVEITYEA
jgi:hypothetical protein